VPYSIQIAKVGSQEAPGPEVFFMDSFDIFLPLWFTMAIVRGEGRTIAINTGFESDVRHLVEGFPKWHPRAIFARADDERIERVLERMDVKPDDVDTVVLTPLGSYSSGNISLFRKAQVCLLRSGWAALLAPGPYAPDRPPTVAVPPSELNYLLTDGWPRVRLLEDDYEVAPGITTFFTGVHHPSSMAIVIPTARGRAVYTDSSFYFRNVEEDIPVGIGRSLEEARRSYARIRKTADLLIPAYDPAIFERYPGGRIG
jgi:glyoxylase-like metal-dependent hydrolase (beta-lactamase superfamily II)